MVADLMIGQQVNQWKARLATVSSNLLDLIGAESTKAIRARLKDADRGYTGVTLEKATHAVEKLDELLDQYTRLDRVIDEAASLVGKGNISRDKEERIRALLDGQSVVLATQHIALSSRGLLDDSNREVRATPSEVLAKMEQAFIEAREALVAITNATDRLQPRLAALEQKMALLVPWASSLGMAGATSLPDIPSALSRVQCDPLGNAAEVDQIESWVARWRAELQTLDTERQAVLAKIEQGKAAVAELRDLAARSAAALTEAHATLADLAKLIPPPGIEAVESLDTWLKALEQNTAAGRFAAVKVGLARWEQECHDQLEAARTSYAQNQAGLDERTELRGRYKALRAKADALRSRGMVLSEAGEALSREAKTILDAVPFDIGAGRRCVAAFEAAVAAVQR